MKILAFVLCGILRAGTLDSAIPIEVERYARDIRSVAQASEPMSLEDVFEEGVAAAAKLREGRLLEDLDEASYRRVQTLMMGFTVGRCQRR
jgi:hypothetical protein